MHENETAREVVSCAYEIHRALGPGLLESVYEEILAMELERRGVPCVRQAPMVVRWRGAPLETQFRADLLVRDHLIVELKAIEKLAPVHARQLLTYLRATDLRLGLLVNFGAHLLRDNVVRMANRLEE